MATATPTEVRPSAYMMGTSRQLKAVADKRAEANSETAHPCDLKGAGGRAGAQKEKGLEGKAQGEARATVSPPCAPALCFAVRERLQHFIPAPAQAEPTETMCHARSRVARRSLRGQMVMQLRSRSLAEA